MLKSLISIVIPVYQVREYLVQCIDSVINQTYDNLEIILVDDGSTDGSSYICDEYAIKDKRIRVVHKENGGLSSARNIGIELANGEYIAFIDSDDWIDNRYIEILYKLCEDNNCEIAQCAHWDIWTEKDYHVDKETTPFIFDPTQLAYAFDSIELWQSILAWNKLYRIELFDGIRYPEGRIHEDEFVSYRVMWKANKIAQTYTKLYYYRRCRENSIKNQKYSYSRLDADVAYEQKAKFYEDAMEKGLSLLTKKRHCIWLNEQIKLIRQSNLNDKNLLIEKLNEKANKLEEALNVENIEYKQEEFHGFIFPFGIVPSNSKIILYGAGKVGKQFFRQITTTNYCDIVAWIDKNSNQCNKQGLPTHPIKQLLYFKNTCDYIVIAIKDKETSKKIIDELENLYEIDANKIIYEINYF